MRLNDQNGPCFSIGKGLRQGYPMSHLLFNLVVDVFTKVLRKAASHGIISGLLTDMYMLDTRIGSKQIRLNQPA